MRIGRNILSIFFFIVLIGVPLYAIGARAFGPSVLGFHLHPLLRPTFLFTLTQAGLSLVTALSIGGLAGVLLSRWDSPLIRGFLFASFSLPSLAVVGMGMSFARKTEFGLGPIVFAHAYLNAPWIALAVMDALATFPKPWAEAARSLGSDRTTLSFKLLFPWIYPRVALAGAQVFAFCVMSFTIVFLLGGGPASGTLETEIYSQVRGAGLDLAGAAQFAIAQILLASLPLVFVMQRSVQGEKSVDVVATHESKPRSRTATALVVLWFLLPLLVMVVGQSPLSLAGHLFSLFRDPEFWKAFGLTSWIALGSALSALVISLPFALSRVGWIRALGVIPVGMSPLVLCLGFLIAYSTGRFAWIDPFEGSVLAIILLHAALLLPLGLRFLVPVVRDSEEPARRNLLLAARTLGASAWVSWWRVEGPIWRRAVSDFARIAWVWSFADLAVLSFFGSEHLTTLPVFISRMMARYEFEAASALLFFVALLSGSILIAGRGKK